MGTLYPYAIKDDWTDLIDQNTYPAASHIEDAYLEITAIETELGIDPAGIHANVVTRLSTITNLSTMTEGKKRKVNIESFAYDSLNSPLCDQWTDSNVTFPVAYFPHTSDTKIHWVWNIPPDCDTDYNIYLIMDYHGGDIIGYGNVKMELIYFTTVIIGNSAIGTPLLETINPSGQLYVSVNNTYPMRNSSLYISSINISNESTLYCTLQRDVSDELTDQYAGRFGLFNLAFEYTCKDPSS